MSSTVKVTLTHAEANALWHLANNSADFREDAMAILGDAASVDAGYRAMRKLEVAGALR
jgi:hypothetical protein